MFTLTQRFLNSVATPTAILRSECSRNESHHTASLFRFVRVDIEKRIPCCIRDTFSQMVILDHPGNVQILKGKSIELSNQVKRALVKEIVSLPRYFQMLLRQKLNSFPAITAAKFLAGDSPVRGLESPLCRPQVLGILNRFSGGESGEVLDPQVNADRSPSLRQVAALVFFHRKHDNPAVHLPLDGAGLDSPCDGARETEADTPDLREMEFIAFEFEAALGIAERIVAPLSLETGEADLVGGDSFPYPSEECVEGFGEATKRILGNLRIKRINVFSDEFESGKLILLLLVVDGDAVELPRITAFLQSGIIEFSAHIQRTLKGLRDALARPQLELIGFHSKSILQRDLCESNGYLRHGIHPLAEARGLLPKTVKIWVVAQRREIKVSTACDSERVSCCLKTRPLPQAVLTSPSFEPLPNLNRIPPA